MADKDNTPATAADIGAASTLVALSDQLAALCAVLHAVLIGSCWIRRAKANAGLQRATRAASWCGWRWRGRCRCRCRWHGRGRRAGRWPNVNSGVAVRLTGDDSRVLWVRLQHICQPASTWLAAIHHASQYTCAMRLALAAVGAVKACQCHQCGRARHATSRSDRDIRSPLQPHAQFVAQFT